MSENPDQDLNSIAVDNWRHPIEGPPPAEPKTAQPSEHTSKEPAKEPEKKK